MAVDFQAFIKLLYERPVHFFNKLLLGYTRFYDGRTTNEWIPKRYVPNGQNPAVGR